VGEGYPWAFEMLVSKFITIISTTTLSCRSNHAIALMNNLQQLKLAADE
jgi:hypothetical protein